MQRAWVHHGAQDVGKLYFHRVEVVVYSLQRAPPETSVRETALPFLRVKLAGTWGRRVTRWMAQLTSSLRRGSTSCFHFKLTFPALIPVLRGELAEFHAFKLGSFHWRPNHDLVWAIVSLEPILVANWSQQLVLKKLPFMDQFGQLLWSEGEGGQFSFASFPWPVFSN